MIIAEETRAEMKQILGEIQSGSSPRSGSPRTGPAGELQRACASEHADHQIEEVGSELRGMMSWIDTEF